LGVVGVELGAVGELGEVPLSGVLLPPSIVPPPPGMLPPP